MGAEKIKNLFDPYVNMYKSGEGLGMASSFSIVKRHGGYIDVLSGDVTTFSIYIRKSGEATAKEEKQADTDGPARQGRVLLMDDEEYILEVTEKMLSYMDYAVVRTRDGEEAIKEYRKSLEEGIPFDFVITDLTVRGGMGGRETMEKLKEIDPSVKGIVSSGYSDDTVMANYHQYGFMGVLLKPYRLQDIERVIKDIFPDSE